MPSLPAAVTIRDVGPRDGLQPEEPVAVEDRIGLVHALADAGVRHIEVAAFVSPRAVPAMAGAAEVVAGIERRAGVTYAALVPNVRGAELALATGGVDELTVTVSASEAYNRRNVRMGIEDSVAAIGAIVGLAAQAGPRPGGSGGSRAPDGGPDDGGPIGGVPVDAVISCAFGSPYEGEIAPADVVALASRLVAAGVSSLTFADTTGMATPRRIAELVEALEGMSWDGDQAAPRRAGSTVPADRADPPGQARLGLPADLSSIGLHLHDTRGTALVNAYAALGLGVTRFDTAVGGLGGSPFAHGAGGNLATEELVALLDDLGVATGIDVDGLVEAALLVESLVGRPVPSGVAHAGPRSRLSPSA